MKQERSTLSNPSALDFDFEQRVRTSFARQGLIKTLNGKIAFISPGERFSQQDGFLHAGIVTTLMDSASRRDPACGTGCG